MSMERDVSREKVTKIFTFSPEAPEYDDDYYRDNTKDVEDVSVEDIDRDEIEWYISTNYYGASVLNTPHVFIADVDTEEMDSPLLRLFRDEYFCKDEYLAFFDKKFGDGKYGNFRIYETAAGFRIFRVDATMDPTSQESSDLMIEMKADKLYASCCVGQATYRARLSPKPSRIGMCDPQKGGASIEDWLIEYHKKAKGYAVCNLIVNGLPSEEIVDKQILSVILEHDFNCFNDGESLA